MQISEFKNNTIITADRGKYLIPKNLPDGISLEDMGKPVRIIFDNTGVIPEFEEREVTE